jgi:cytidylate kinase
MENVIAIDGPAASGKSTVAKGVAAALGRLYVDSGALYRAITWKALEDGVDTADGGAVAALAGRMTPDFLVDGRAVAFTVDGQPLGAELRTDAINQHVSPVAVVPEARAQVVAWLRGMTSLGDLVMEGRDIGTAVFPDATHKFYLDASPEERARRRHAEITTDLEPTADVEAVGASLQRRDRIDSSRKTDPLKVAPGATVVDSTGMSIDQVVMFIVDRVSAKH